MSVQSMLPEELSENSLMLTPLLDLMFLVLIFFALNLSYEKFNALQVIVPESKNITTLNAEEDPHYLQISPSGEIFLDDKKMNLTKMREEVSLLNNDNDRLVLYIAGDRTVEYSLLMRVLDELTSIGVYQINLISEEE
jgi:biopolymer transport protein ExbD